MVVILEEKNTGRDVLNSTTADSSRHVEIQKKLLFESEAKFKALFDLAPYGCAVNDLDSRYLLVNQAFCEILGFRIEEIIGVTPFELGIVSDKESTERVRATLLRRGGVSNQEVIVKSRMGETRIGIYSSKIIEWGSGRAILSATIDITERKRAEEALRESETRFRTFYHSTPEGIVFFDLDGKIVDVNNSFLEMSEYTLTELMHRRLSDLVPLQLRETAERTFISIKGGYGFKDPAELMLKKKNGNIVPVSIKGWRMSDDRKRVPLLGAFVHNLTSEKKLSSEKEALEKQLMHAQKIEAIGTLANGIAHDLNNVLSGIIGYTELALLDELETPDNKKHRYLSHVLDAANRAKELARQILTFGRQKESPLASISLVPIIEESVKLLRATLPSTIRIDQRLSDPHHLIHGESTQIHQVLMNLCINAYHAMRDAGGILTISLQAEFLKERKEVMGLKVPPGEYVKLSVSDTGCGISPQAVERIFDPYFTTKAEGEGTGLGLSVTLGIIKGHGGLIEVQSQAGKGTRFDIHFPVIRETETEKTGSAGEVPKGRNQNILVVDDEFIFLDVTRHTLEFLGYRVIPCLSSIKALEIFKTMQEEIDLLITDQTMPEMTGVQLLSEIRKINPVLPVVLATGFSESVTEQSKARYGINVLLMKPIQVADLARAVHNAFGGAA